MKPDRDRARRLPVPRLDSRGVSLIDLIMAMIIFGMVLAAALPGFNSMKEGYRHKGSLDRVTSRMFLTRQMAVRDKFPYVLTLDIPNRALSAFGDTNANGIQDGGEAVFGPWTMYDGVALVNVSWPGAQLTFFPNGRASQTADLRVVDDYGRSRTVRVSAITGNAEVLP